MSKTKLNAAVSVASVKVGTKAASKQTALAVPTTKLEALIGLLKRPKGATLEEMMQATGWQRHSIHGTLSGALKKRRGLPVIAEYGDKGRTYRIAGATR